MAGPARAQAIRPDDLDLFRFTAFAASKRNLLQLLL